MFSVKRQVTLDSMRYVIALGAPHSRHHSAMTYALGEESLRPAVIKDDFQASWADIEVVNQDPNYWTYWGNLNYLQILKRDHPLIMKPGQQYRLEVEFEPDIQFADE